MKISIIIPVYQAEQYLPQMIRSVVAQTYPHWQLVLVVDGATDRSAAICRSYAQGDPRIVVLEQTNQGAGAARNHGLAHATGDCVCFVDSDDWMEPDMLQCMADTMTDYDADIVVTGYYNEYANSSKAVANDGNVAILNRDDALLASLSNKLHSYLWRMLFRRQLLREPMSNSRRYEDLTTIFQWMSHANRIVCLNRALYHYRQVGTSLMHTGDSYDNNSDRLQALQARMGYIQANNLLEHHQQEVNGLYLRELIKMAKDFSRSNSPYDQKKRFVEMIMDKAKPIAHVAHRQLGWKRAIRFMMMRWSIPMFIRVTQFSGCFAKRCGRQRHQLY